MTYTDTVSANSGVDQVNVGDAAVITFALDNGSITSLSQTWTASDIVSVTFDFGTYSTTFDPNGGNGLNDTEGTFVTDGAGTLTAVPSNWTDLSPDNVTATNSPQTPFLWLINGTNSVYTTNGGQIALTNVGDNIIASNWTIEPADTPTTPEPTSVIALIGVGILGVASKKLKKKA